MRVPKYLSVAQCLPNSYLTFPGPVPLENGLETAIDFLHLHIKKLLKQEKVQIPKGFAKL